jgi:hypothetical protein
LVDGEEFPLLEVRELFIYPAPGTAPAEKRDEELEVDEQ